MKVIVQPSTAAVSSSLAVELDNYSGKAQGVFRVGISGGSLVDLLAVTLPLVKSDLSKWKFYMCDERYVPAEHADSNLASFKAKVLSRVPQLSEKQCVEANTSLPLAACAADYEQRILNDFHLTKGQIPVFDVLLLGMGPDGHTCSLFPGHKLLNEQSALIAPIADSPKPPPGRITMTLPLINKARCCLFALTGAGKADMIKRVFVDKDQSLPASLINPNNVLLIVDNEAGLHLKK